MGRLYSYSQLLLRQPIAIYTRPWYASSRIHAPNEDLPVEGSGADATATVASGEVDAVTLGAGGTGYAVAPLVVVVGGGATTPAQISATVAAGIVTALTIDDGGEGYTSAPTIVIVTWTPIGESPAIEEISGADGVTITKPHGMDFLMGAGSHVPLAAARTEDKTQIALSCYDQRIAAIGFALDRDVRSIAAAAPAAATQRVWLSRPKVPKHYTVIARGVIAGESERLGQFVLPRAVNSSPWEQMRSVTKWSMHKLMLEALSDMSIAEEAARLGWLDELVA